MNKKEARKYVKQTLKKMSKEKRLLREEELLEKLSNHKQFLQAKKIGIYYPLKHEINLLVLMKLFPNKEYYFPKTKSQDMDFRKIVYLDQLVDGKFDLKEPSFNEPVEENIDVYLVPCLGAYKNYRLGHGAGYYDRYFAREKGYKIGITYEEFKDLNITVDSHDIPMDEIL